MEFVFIIYLYLLLSINYFENRNLVTNMDWLNPFNLEKGGLTHLWDH